MTLEQLHNYEMNWDDTLQENDYIFIESMSEMYLIKDYVYALFIMQPPEYITQVYHSLVGHTIRDIQCHNKVPQLLKIKFYRHP